MPIEGKTAGEPQALRTVLVPSPIGVLRATLGARGLRRLEFSSRRPRAVAVPGDDAAARQLARELAAYFAGTPGGFRTELDLSSGTDFQRRVWTALRKVPFGRTVSYGELSRRAGAPRAARAVGQAVGANPIPIIIPCHRVIRSSGALGGFSAGLEIKRWLLQHEGCL